MGVRKNQHLLSAAEKTRYVSAVKRMKRMAGGAFTPTTGAPSVSLNLYDKYVQWHFDSITYTMMMTAMATGGVMPGEQLLNHAHATPGFGPWHRAMILFFELDLRAADDLERQDAQTAGRPLDVYATPITLPYWDWTYDNSAKANDQRGSIWKDDFMGPDGDGDRNAVTHGPFRQGQWMTYQRPGNPATDPTIDPTSFLRRKFNDSLPSDSDVRDVMLLTPYDQYPWDRTGTLATFRNGLEGFYPGPGGHMHNLVHGWVGGEAGDRTPGTMSVPAYSPNDPIFFLHHCNIDRLWSVWQANNPRPGYPDGRPTGGTLPNPAVEWGGDATYPPRGTGLDEPMFPWHGTTHNGLPLPTVTARDVLDHTNITIDGNQVGYTYDRTSSGAQ